MRKIQMYTCKWNQFRFEIVETEISCVCAWTFWCITRRVFWSRRSSTGFIFSTTIGVTSSWLISIQSPNWQQNDDNSIFIVFIMIEIVTHFCKKLGQARKLWKLMQQTNGWNSLGGRTLNKIILSLLQPTNPRVFAIFVQLHCGANTAKLFAWLSHG